MIKAKPEDKIIALVVKLALSTFAVWWFFASWYPQFGFTYWQLILPVWAVGLVVRGETALP